MQEKWVVLFNLFHRGGAYSECHHRRTNTIIDGSWNEPQPQLKNLLSMLWQHQEASSNHCVVANTGEPAGLPSQHALMSTLLLYTCISSFLMISNIHTNFGSIIQLRQYCRMCFEPLVIYVMSFRPFLTISNDFWWFCWISDVCSLISDLSLHQWTIYAFPIL